MKAIRRFADALIATADWVDIVDDAEPASRYSPAEATTG
jgi:hypothetical protein